MSVGGLVRYALGLIIVGWLIALAGLYILRVWVEDTRPMSVRIESGLPHDATFRLRAEIENPAGKPLVPQIRVEGLDDSSTVVVPLGEVVELPVRLEVPGGVWPIITGKITTGDVKGIVHVEPVSPVPNYSPQDIELSVHVATIWESYWPMVFWTLMSLGAFVLLWLFARFVLVPPSGWLKVLQRDGEEVCYDSAGSAMQYNLSDPRFHSRLFWMRDLLRANTGWFTNLTIQLHDANAPPFCLQFTTVGPTLSCPRGELDVREAGYDDRFIRVADLTRVANWRKRQSQTVDTETPRSVQASANESLAEEEGSLYFSPPMKQHFETDVSVEKELHDYLPLDDGAAIVAGNYLVVYEGTK